nr:chromo domain protein LHP1-like isoform X2 [Erigeron canadensis]
MKGGPRRKTDQPQLHRVRSDVVSSESEQNREQQMNDAIDHRYEDEEEEDDDDDDDDEYDEDYEDQFNENEDDDEQGGRPKLAEGYYEIETVRKKRSRKGQVQYLIKWRGWPETSNTWEPVENLISCSDIIDAFEERMKSTKQKSSKKHKRKSGVALQPPPAKKKKQQPQQQQQQPPGSPPANYDVPAIKLRLLDEPLSRSSGNDPSCSKWTESSARGVRNVRKAKHVNENGSLSVSRQIDDMNEANELNVTLSELKGTASTDKENTYKPDVHIQEDQPGGVGPSNGISNVNGQNSVWVSRNCGSKRRKSSSVKRFTQDTNPVFTNDVHDAIEKIASANVGVVERGIQKLDQVGNYVGSVNVVDTTRSMYAITKIIKPIEYSISKLNDMQEILVTFLVLRSDGKEVMVDNRYLKANYPYL